MVFLFGCAVEYKPNGEIPNEDDPVEMIFSDSIGNMGSNIKLEFMNDSCRSISATYGDNNEIYYQIILVENDVVATKECIEKEFMPLFEDYRNVKKNKDGFYAFASDDFYDIATWYKKNYVFLLKVKKEYVEKAVSGSYFLKFK